jgi:uncharacterized FlgJ-related protein
MKKTQESQETSEVELFYILTSQTKDFGEIGKKRVYGIEIKSVIKENVEDISTDRNLVLSLLQKLAQEQCSPHHLKDVVEDFIIEPYI